MKIAIIGSFRTSLPLKQGLIHAPLLLSFDLARKLAGYGHEVTYFGSYDEGYDRQFNIKFENFEYNKIPQEIEREYGSKPAYQLTGLAYEQSYIARALQLEDQFDLFYSWSINRVGPLARLTKKPAVISHHDSTSFPEHELLLSALKSPNLFHLPISKYVADNLKYENTLSVVYNGMDIGQIDNLQPRSDYFMWVGRIVPPKGLDIALDLAESKGIQLKIAGGRGPFSDFPEVDEYTRKIFERIDKLPNVEYLGALSHDEVLKHLSLALGLIFPTDGTEACPMVAIESMMCGAPVITSGKGPMPEIIDQGVTGVMCEHLSEYEKAIDAIVAYDRDKCIERAVKRFSLDTMARGYEKEFEQAIHDYNHAKEGSSETN